MEAAFAASTVERQAGVARKDCLRRQPLAVKFITERVSRGVEPPTLVPHAATYKPWDRVPGFVVSWVGQSTVIIKFPPERYY